MPPVKSKNGLKQGTFCNEFNDYLEKLSCMNGNIATRVAIQSTELVSLYIGYWTLNNYYYCYSRRL